MRAIVMRSLGGPEVLTVNHDPALAVLSACTGKRVATMAVEPDLVSLEGLARLADEGRLRVLVDQVVPLEDTAGPTRYSRPAA